jgi:hypothetical protein
MSLDELVLEQVSKKNGNIDGIDVYFISIY